MHRLDAGTDWPPVTHGTHVKHDNFVGRQKHVTAEGLSGHLPTTVHGDKYLRIGLLSFFPRQRKTHAVNSDNEKVGSQGQSFLTRLDFDHEITIMNNTFGPTTKVTESVVKPYRPVPHPHPTTLAGGCGWDPIPLCIILYISC